MPARLGTYDRLVRVAWLIFLWAVIAVVVTAFLGSSIPPCTGRVPDGRMSQECIDAWVAQRGAVEWLLSTPFPEIGGFLIASVVTIWWFRRPRTHQ